MSLSRSTTSSSHQPSEITPLLSAQANINDAVATPADPTSGPTIEDATSKHGQDDGEDDDEDAGDIERTASRISARKFEGLPDVKKRMVYIFPALAIGVFLGAADQTLIVSSYGKISRR